MTPLSKGTALSQTDSNANIVPRSSTGTSFEVIDLNAGATVGPWCSYKRTVSKFA